MLLAVHPSLPVKSVKELIAFAKKNPGKLNYSSSGTGGNNHFSGALFASAAGIKLTHVPYKGIAPAVLAVGSGEVEMVISSSSALLPMVNAHKVRILGVSSLEPSPMFPGVPSIAQSGAPGYQYQLWWGLFAPAGLPAERVAFINAAVNKMLATPDMKKFLDTQGTEAWPQTPGADRRSAAEGDRALQKSDGTGRDTAAVILRYRHQVENGEVHEAVLCSGLAGCRLRVSGAACQRAIRQS